MSTANAVLDAVGDGTRRDILRLLAEHPRSVGDLAERLPVSRPAVSQHLRVLSEADLVSAEAKGTRRVYRLDGAGAAHGRSFFDSLWDTALDRFAELADRTQPDQGEGR